MGAPLIRRPEPDDARPPMPIWPTVRALYGILPGPLRRRWLSLAVLAGLCSFAELATTALLLRVIQLATQPAGAARQAGWAWLPASPHGWRGAVLATALIAAVFLLRAALALALTVATSTATVTTGIFVAERLFADYVRMPYARFRQRRIADLQRRVTALAKTVVSQVFRPGVQLVTDTAVIAAVLAIMVTASPWGTLAAALVVVTVSVVLIRAVNPRLFRTAVRIDQQDRSANVFVDQVLRGRREITLRHHEAPVVASYLAERRAVIVPSRQSAVLLDLPRIVIEAITMVLVAGLILFAVGLELDTPRVVATLGLFAYALLRLMPLAGRVAANLGSFRAGLPILDDLIRDILPASAEGGQATAAPIGPPEDASVWIGAVEFRQVTASYENGRRPALRNVTVRIEPGSFVGVVGSSGAGKSTFVDLLVGLLAPTSGEVLVGGRPLQDLPAGWQARVGVVSQEPYIFNDSIRRNVALFTATVDDARVVTVLQDVGLWELVQQLPRGLDTELGERGSALSGGQRQRLAMARALYSDPDLLVLDEATSALDAEGEATVMRAALRHHAPRTVVAVTHRASAIAECDQIVVLEDGLMTAVGSYADVLRTSAYFARLVSPLVPGASR
jgi:ABC-type multidrug transport system fused ATPase/permease subunit